MKKNHEILDVLNERAQQPFVRMRFKIVYMENSQVVHEVEVRKVNYLDLERHLQAGETVEIIPEFAGHDVERDNYDKMPCYITHF